MTKRATDLEKKEKKYNNEVEKYNKKVKTINDKYSKLNNARTEYEQIAKNLEEKRKEYNKLYKEYNKLYSELSDDISKVDALKADYGLMMTHDNRKSLYKKPCLSNLFIEVTSRCNAFCEHCGSRCDAHEKGEEIDALYLKKTLKEISEHYDASKVFLDITGGEPTIRKDLFDIMKYAVDLGFKWGMTTNGMLITPSMLKKIEDAKMSTASISIDGLPKTHEDFRKVPNCFSKILRSIKMLQESPVVQIVQVTTVVNKKNIDQLEDIYNLLLENGVEYWRVINCDPIGRASDNSDILLDLDQYKYMFDFILEKQAEHKMKQIAYGCSHYLGMELEAKVRPNYFICMAGLTIGSILSNGDIYVCPNVPRRPELIQGNIKNDSFVDVWENKYKEFRSEKLRGNPTCKKCKHWKYCAGDSLHTYNFDENKPNICLKELYDKK